MSAEPLTPSISIRLLTKVFAGAAALAAYAPSIRNSQPWRWRLAGSTLDLHLESDRILELTDPDARFAVMSCGAALQHARISLAATSWWAAIDRLPDAADPTRLARITLDGRMPADPEAVAQTRAVRVRRTDRRLHPQRPVDPDDLLRFTAAGEAEGASLRVLTAAEGEALGAAPDLPHGPDTGLPPDPAATLVVLHGPQDRRVDWLLAGEALSAGWLAGTEHGVAVLPLSAPVDGAVAREAIHRLVPGLGHPYLLLRLAAPGTDPAEGSATPPEPRLHPEPVVERDSIPKR